MSKHALRGTFTEKDFKHLRKSEEEKEMKRRRAVRELQLKCNHIDRSNGKNKLKPVDGQHGFRKCKICKAIINANPDILNAETIDEAAELMYSAISIVRNQISLKAKMDDKLVSAMEVIDSLSDIFKDMQSQIKERGKKKDKNKKKKNKDKEGKKAKKRVRY